MTNLLIVWYDVHGEKRAPAAPGLWPHFVYIDMSSCCRVKVVVKWRKPFGRERKKEMRRCLRDYTQFTSLGTLGLCRDSLESVSSGQAQSQKRNQPARPSQQV